MNDRPRTTAKLHRSRMEAFSDGVIAIVITIMVLELKVPHGEGFKDLIPLLPAAFAYLLSVAFVGLWWNNHHHLLQATDGTNGAILWANLHFLFWVSLIPFASAWMGESGFASRPVAFYGFILMGVTIGYYLLQRTILAHQAVDSVLRAAVAGDQKWEFSFGLYGMGVLLALVHFQWLAPVAYALASAAWLAPDRRIEDRLSLGAEDDELDDQPKRKEVVQ